MTPYLLSITGDRPPYVGRRGWFKRLSKGFPLALIARQAVRLFKMKHPGFPVPATLTLRPVAPAAAPAVEPAARTITPAEIEQVNKAPVGPVAPAAAPSRDEGPADEGPADEGTTEDEGTEDEQAE